MKELLIGQTRIQCKDYLCSQDDWYPPKKEPRLWLYIHLTDACPAACPFCVYSRMKTGGINHLDPEKLRQALNKIAPFVSGVSLTGGEPMADLGLLEETIQVIREEISPEIELDMVTNGLNIQKLPAVNGIERFTTVHVSRHAVDDKKNASLMCWENAPSRNELKSVFSSLSDPGLIVLNCVLQKHGVHDHDSVCEYLEMAADTGAANVSLIGMFLANEYCRDNYVSPLSLDLASDPRFSVWNHFHDHEYCECSSGDYLAGAGYIRYYYRCPGNVPPSDYCRQLVYGSDNRLRDGFGEANCIII